MIARDYIDIAIFALGIIFSILGWLTTRKLDTMERHTAKLFELHNTDVKDLRDCELKVSETHPTKDDLKDVVSNLKEYLNERFNNVEQIARYSGLTDRRNNPRDSGDNHGR